MIVDARELIFIKKNAPFGMLRTLSENIGMEYSKVRAAFYYIKDEVSDDLMVEARRLLKENTGLVYQENQEA